MRGNLGSSHMKKGATLAGGPLVHVPMNVTQNRAELARFGKVYTDRVSRSIGSSSRTLAACSRCFL